MHRYTREHVFEKNGCARVVRNAHRDCDVPAVREKAHLKENGIRRMLRNATGNRTDSSRWPSRATLTNVSQAFRRFHYGFRYKFLSPPIVRRHRDSVSITEGHLYGKRPFDPRRRSIESDRGIASTGTRLTEAKTSAMISQMFKLGLERRDRVYA